MALKGNIIKCRTHKYIPLPTEPTGNTTTCPSLQYSYVPICVTAICTFPQYQQVCHWNLTHHNISPTEAWANPTIWSFLSKMYRYCNCSDCRDPTSGCTIDSFKNSAKSTVVFTLLMIPSLSRQCYSYCHNLIELLGPQQQTSTVFSEFVPWYRPLRYHHNSPPSASLQQFHFLATQNFSV